MKQCLRCGQEGQDSSIGAALVNFVCDVCRIDRTAWMFRGKGDVIAYTMDEMEYQSPLPETESF